MWAVVEIGKKQYMVSPGEQVQVQRLKTDESNIVFDKVLLVSDSGKVSVGTPYVEKAKVKAKILGEEKGKKVRVYKFKRRKKYRKTQGHRQRYSRIEISDISTPSR
ncbi:MAG: 50S ribosomal protein L21 [Candidatus Omnitrophica bacterium]|nr:50S ribosomal protein L21 [Candidatus Omnitrophota bacterium]